jgi:protocatechuate 3,4-dioxygenase beta subunit
MKALRFSMILICMTVMHGVSGAAICTPTEPDALGPFYKPDAPVRSSVGKGYVLTGAVRSAADCSPISGARIEFWMAGPDGGYADAYRATLFSGISGAYRFESHIPPPYYGRPRHIHILVSAPGFRMLVTQHYPETGRTAAVFDLVLVPEIKKQ